MKLKRYWASPYEIGKEWDQILTVSPERMALSFSAGSLEVEGHGFRFNSTKFAEVRIPKVVLGGSTTFGHYCSRSDSWPEQLENLIGETVFNCGQPKSDVWMSLQNLVHFVRSNLEMKIDKVITYDGVNQNAGFNQFIRNSNSYRPEHTNFQQLDRIMEVFRLVTSTSFNRYQLFLFLFGTRYREKLLRRIELDRKKKGGATQIQTLEYFAVSEAQLYCSTLRVMKSFVEKSLDSQLIAFLQPTLFDYFKPSWDDRNRAQYLRILYDAILEYEKDVIDLRGIPLLLPEDFIDWAHLTPSGNLKVARAISNFL